MLDDSRMETSSDKGTAEVSTTRDLVYGSGLVLPQGTYTVDHLSPWGPVITEVNGLGHGLIVPTDAVKL